MSTLITSIEGFNLFASKILFLLKNYDLIIRSIERANIYFESLEVEE